MSSDYVEILRQVLSQPTSPFHEQAVVEYIRSFAEARGLDFSTDRTGNVLLHYRRGRKRLMPRWVLAAHMDHPGFVATNRRGRTLWAEFRGSVDKKYFPRSSVRFFTPDGEVTGLIERVKPVSRGKWCHWLEVRVKLNEPLDVPSGSVGMWDFPAVRIRGKKVSARGCDDLAGVASVLCAMDEIASKKINADVMGLFTRAEEVGFVGALAACRDCSIRRDSLLVAIETSQAQPHAPLGGGVVIRVGDKTRTFDPALTAHLVDVAEDLKKRDENFCFRRQLMPGGTCESTAYYACGYRAGALCIPLGNYHNCGRDGHVAPEQINLDDFTNLVRLLVGLAKSPVKPADDDAALKARLEEHLKTMEKYLTTNVK